MTDIIGEALEFDLGYGSVVHVPTPGALPPVYDRKENEIAAVAESYYTNRYLEDGETFRFAYNWRCTYRNEAFSLGNIDCSALAGLILRGLYYKDSPYGLAYAKGDGKPNGEFGDWVGVRNDGSYYCQAKVDRDGYNGASSVDEYINGSDPYVKPPEGQPSDGIPDDWDPTLNENPDPRYDPDVVTCNPAMNWAINPREYWCLGNYKSDMDDGDDDDEESTATTIPAQGRPLSAANLAQLLLTMGYVVPIDGGFSDLRKGDFLFWASIWETGDKAGEYRQPRRFLHINHVGVVTEIDEGKHYYIDSYDSAHPIRKACLETDAPKAEYLVLAVRLRYGRAWEHIRIIYNPQDREMTVGETQRFTCISVGDIMHYQWQWSDDDLSDETITPTWTNSTLPRMASVAVTPNANMGRLVTVTDPVTEEVVETYRERHYRCVCTDTHGRSLTSRNARLKIYAEAGE